MAFLYKKRLQMGEGAFFFYLSKTPAGRSWRELNQIMTVYEKIHVKQGAINTCPDPTRRRCVYSPGAE